MSSSPKKYRNMAKLCFIVSLLFRIKYIVCAET